MVVVRSLVAWLLAVLALLACLLALSQSKLRTVKIAREHITNRSALVQESTDMAIRGRERMDVRCQQGNEKTLIR